MGGCRGIYIHLFLLSVILFSLATFAHPLLHSNCTPGVCLVDGCRSEVNEHASWEERSASLVYAPHQLIGPLWNDLGWIAPAGGIEPAWETRAPVYNPMPVLAPPFRPPLPGDSRAPPRA